jgi:hypothetical protein
VITLKDISKFPESKQREIQEMIASYLRNGYEPGFLFLDGRGSVIYDRDAHEDFLTLQNIPGPKDTP